jgi:hypothetical protein
MMEEVYLKRIEYDNKQTLGELIYGEFKCKTLELPWLNNERKISCIPSGEYNVIKRVSAKYGNHFYVTNVEDRSYILIHAGNYHQDTLGCILVGRAHQDINNDGHRDVTQSKPTMTQLNRLFPNEFKLIIG